ncbi:MAG: tetraacyldisaccharide 4'-kinase, partial [Flavobacteriales bacterium]
MVKIIRYILFPFSILYGLIVAFRNFLFDKKIMKSSEFDVKTIQVGNLSAGGTGKTPHVEYLIRLLKCDYKTATLSRGYGR